MQQFKSCSIFIIYLNRSRILFILRSYKDQPREYLLEQKTNHYAINGERFNILVIL